jgi:hypothetical protein
VAFQLLADAVVVAWLVGCVVVARTVQDVLARLQGPARSLVGAGEAIRGAFDGAARTAAEVPLVGDALAGALGSGTGAGDSLAAAGREQAETITAVGQGSAIGIVLLGALPVLLVWLPLRLLYARAASSAITARRDDGGVVRALAALELASLGLREPPPPAP